MIHKQSCSNNYLAEVCTVTTYLYMVDFFLHVNNQFCTVYVAKELNSAGTCFYMYTTDICCADYTVLESSGCRKASEDLRSSMSSFTSTDMDRIAEIPLLEELLDMFQYDWCILDYHPLALLYKTLCIIASFQKYLYYLKLHVWIFKISNDIINNLMAKGASIFMSWETNESYLPTETYCSAKFFRA